MYRERTCFYSYDTGLARVCEFKTNFRSSRDIVEVTSKVKIIDYKTCGYDDLLGMVLGMVNHLTKKLTASRSGMRKRVIIVAHNELHKSEEPLVVRTSIDKLPTSETVRAFLKDTIFIPNEPITFYITVSLQM